MEINGILGILKFYGDASTACFLVFSGCSWINELNYFEMKQECKLKWSNGCFAIFCDVMQFKKMRLRDTPWDRQVRTVPASDYAPQFSWPMGWPTALNWWALPEVRHVIPVHLGLNKCPPSNLGIVYSLDPFWDLFGAFHEGWDLSLISASYAVPSFPIQLCLVIVTLIGRQRLWLGAASELQVNTCDQLWHWHNFPSLAGESSANATWFIVGVWNSVFRFSSWLLERIVFLLLEHMLQDATGLHGDWFIYVRLASIWCPSDYLLRFFHYCTTCPKFLRTSPWLAFGNARSSTRDTPWTSHRLLVSPCRATETSIGSCSHLHVQNARQGGQWLDHCQLVSHIVVGNLHSRYAARFFWDFPIESRVKGREPFYYYPLVN